MRHFHAKRLDERALINLPIPLPSIPIINPIITPLIAGVPTTHHTTSTPTPSSQPPAQQPTTTPSSPTPTSPQQEPAPASPSSQPSSGESSSSGSASNGGGNSGGSGNANSGSSDGNTGSSGSGSSGSSDTSGNTSGNNGSNNNGSQNQSPSNSTPSNPSSDTSPSSSPDSTNPSNTNNASPVSGSTTDSNGNVASPTASSVPNGALANLASNPSGSTSSDGTSGGSADGSASTNGASGSGTLSASGSNPSSLGSGSSGTGSTPGGGNNSVSGGGDSSGAGGSGAEGSAKHHGLSTGGIVAIVVITSILACIALFCVLRRKSISKRVARRNHWFRRTSASYGGIAISSEKYFADNRVSKRSSFGTNFDNGQRPPSVEEFTWSSSPHSSAHPSETTQILGNVAVPPIAPTAWTPAAPLIRSNSIGSDDSHSTERVRSDSQASQYLEAPYKVGIPDFPSPISVRPFSPSESWNFPQPPADDFRRQSELILAQKLQGSATSFALNVPPSSINQSQSRLSLAAPSVNRASVSDVTDGYMTANDYEASSEIENPFDDFNSVKTDTTNEEHFLSSEIIKRPFVPSMDDEMKVDVGDEVRIKQKFDDGWVFGEKISGEDVGKKGLFPVDCLRGTNVDLPAFLAAKRLSSYGAFERFDAM
ncbi:hypothetical protein C8Q75DRAFT_807596 [Abortiporus biennis]|nr:hypothetical protein C8Q75DRAFT_807596 [Abortiporus biennis]